MPQDTEEIELAKTLYALYYEALGNDRWAWSELEPKEQIAWIICGQWVLASFTSKDDNEPDHK